MIANDFETLINRYLDGIASVDETAKLSDLLESDIHVRRLFLQMAHIHASLSTEATLDPIDIPITPVSQLQPASFPQSFAFGFGLAAVTILVLGILLSNLPIVGHWPAKSDSIAATQVVARMSSLQNCRWVNSQTTWRKGDTLSCGQRLELSSGETQIEFDHGATVVLTGPAIFELISAKESYLVLGQLRARANSIESRGFCVRTRNARFIDFGTEFTAESAADGHSRVDVDSGAVEVLLPMTNDRHLLRAGESMGIEPGQTVVTTRIESGEGTAAFRFPSIEPPSSADYADHSQGNSSIRCLKGSLGQTSGPLELLLNGSGQSAADSPSESVFFSTNEMGLILLNLGKAVPVKKVNTYSWHMDHASDSNRIRATQKFYLYGSSSPEPPNTDGNLTEHGWVLLGRVNTDEFFNVSHPRLRPLQQATSIAATRGSIGTFRYLLWDVRPSRTNDNAVEDNTFYGELDVYVE